MSEEKEIEMFIRRARRSLDATHHLFRGGFYEDAVSRAYYSMYFAAKALLLKRNRFLKKKRNQLSKMQQSF